MDTYSKYMAGLLTLFSVLTYNREAVYWYTFTIVIADAKSKFSFISITQKTFSRESRPGIMQLLYHIRQLDYAKVEESYCVTGQWKGGKFWTIANFT